MKKQLILTFTLILLVLISLSACGSSHDSEPPAPSTVEGEKYTPSPYSDTDVSKRYYITDSGHMSFGVVYGDNYYYISENMSIVAIPLSEAVKHNVMEEGVAKPVTEFTALCFDPLCDHMHDTCPAMMRSDDSGFLIDAYESNGEQPVIYYHRSVGESLGNDGSLNSLGHEIIRFDVASGEAVQVGYSNEPIEQLMAYGDYLYYTTLSSKDEMSISAIKKSGGTANCLATGAAAIKMIGANDQGAYFNDDKGNVYALSIDGKSMEKIYTVSEYYVLGHPGRGAAELNMFIEGEYLYYFADYKIRELPYGNSTEKFNEHSIRRVRLDAPSAEGEIVAESVYDTEVYGVYNGVLYYGPFDVRTNLEDNEWCHSNGTINGVNLETLETFVVISNCGFNFTVHPYYVNDRCIIGQLSPYRDIGYNWLDDYWCTMLLDFETGAIYPVEGDSSLLRSQG